MKILRKASLSMFVARFSQKWYKRKVKYYILYFDRSSPFDIPLVEIHLKLNKTRKLHLPSFIKQQLLNLRQISDLQNFPSMPSMERVALFMTRTRQKNDKRSIIWSLYHIHVNCLCLKVYHVSYYYYADHLLIQNMIAFQTLN